MKNSLKFSFFLSAVLAFATNVVFSGNFAYVSVNTVINVVDLSTNTVIATISPPVPGMLPPFLTGIAVSPDGKVCYVTDNRYSLLDVVDTSTNTLVDQIPVGMNPNDVAFAPNGQVAYVVNTGSDNVSVINTATRQITATINLPPGSEPNGIDTAPNGQFAYVANFGGNSVSIINTSSNTVVGTIPGLPTATDIAVTPNNQFAYVADGVGDFVSVIDLSTNTVIATIPDPLPSPGIFGVAVTPDGKFVYATGFLNEVIVIDTANNSAVDINGTTGGQDTAFSCDGKLAYVSGDPAQIDVIDTTTMTLLETIPLSNVSFGIAIAPCALPPKNLECEREKNDFAVCYELFNELEWDASPFGLTATGYVLYRNGKKIATLGPHTFKYEDHDLKKGKKYTYSLFAVDAFWKFKRTGYGPMLQIRR